MSFGSEQGADKGGSSCRKLSGFFLKTICWNQQPLCHQMEHVNMPWMRTRIGHLGIALRAHQWILHWWWWLLPVAHSYICLHRRCFGFQDSQIPAPLVTMSQVVGTTDHWPVLSITAPSGHLSTSAGRRHDSAELPPPPYSPWIFTRLILTDPRCDPWSWQIAGIKCHKWGRCVERRGGMMADRAD